MAEVWKDSIEQKHKSERATLDLCVNTKRKYWEGAAKNTEGMRDVNEGLTF